MVRRKNSNPEVERRLTPDELDTEIGKVKFRSKHHQEVWDDISSQTWFRQYGKGSKVALRKITKKVKKGILSGKFNQSPDNKRESEPVGRIDSLPSAKPKPEKEKEKEKEKKQRKNKFTVTKLQYTKQVKTVALDFRMVDI